MMQVWFLFKILEAFIGCVCVTYHCLGFVGKEPLPHILIFCGTFFGFTIMSLTGAIALGVGAAPPALTEFIVNFVASNLYIVSSIVSMHFAETDFHLMYLSDFEEPKHPYFSFCRAQSISALAAGSLHLLHAVLAFDVMFTPRIASESEDEDSDSDSEGDMTTLERRPIRMYFLSKVIETKLRRYKWFDHLCTRRSPTVSIFSFARGNKRGSTKIHASAYSIEEKASSKLAPSKSHYLKQTKSARSLINEKKEKKPTKNAKKSPETGTPLNAEDSPESEEEAVSNITYSDFANQQKLEFLNEKSAKPSISSVASKRSSAAAARFALPNDEADADSTTAVHKPQSEATPRPILRTERNASFDEPKGNEKRETPSTSSFIPQSSESENSPSFYAQKLGTPASSVPSMASQAVQPPVASSTPMPLVAPNPSALRESILSLDNSKGNAQSTATEPTKESIVTPTAALPQQKNPSYPPFKESSITSSRQSTASTTPSKKSSKISKRLSVTLSDLPLIVSSPRPSNASITPRSILKSPSQTGKIPSYAELETAAKREENATHKEDAPQPTVADSKLPSQTTKTLPPVESETKPTEESFKNIPAQEPTTPAATIMHTMPKDLAPVPSDSQPTSLSPMRQVSPLASASKLPPQTLKTQSQEQLKTKPSDERQIQEPISPPASKTPSGDKVSTKPTNESQPQVSVSPPASKTPSEDKVSTKPTDQNDEVPAPPVPPSLPSKPSEKSTEDLPPGTKLSKGTSVQSLPYSDDSLSEQPGTTVPDNPPAFTAQESRYFTPTASAVTLFGDPKDDDEATTPKQSKDQIQKPPRS